MMRDDSVLLVLLSCNGYGDALKLLIVDLRQWKMRSGWPASSRGGAETKAAKRAVQQTETEMKIQHGKKR